MRSRPPRRGRAALPWLLGALLALAVSARTARANVDEFATFDVAREESDDENAFDHYLNRTPAAWRAAWEDSTRGFRTSEGCLTSGEWYTAHDFKDRAPITDRTYLDITMVQRDDDAASWQWIDLDFRRPIASAGTFGFRFRPSFDKSQQDFALLWEWGSGHAPLQVQAAFTVVDAFNNLWQFRQIRVGDHGEPYTAHPFESELHVVARGAHHRFEASGTWLTPSRKEILTPTYAFTGSYALWGSKGSALAQADAGRWGFEARADEEQAMSSSVTVGVPGADHSFRRRWSAEGALRRVLATHWRAEARLLYQDRAEDWTPPTADATFHGVDRVRAAEVAWDAHPDWTFRFGVLHDRVGIDRSGLIPFDSYGTRKEARAFIGLQARFGTIRVQGIEGIQLSQKPYPVTWHHDKGFLQLQTTF